jgi:hypothetical protein
MYHSTVYEVYGNSHIPPNLVVERVTTQRKPPEVWICRWRNQLSLSRLNHRLPRGQAHPEVVQGTAEFHHEIADALLPQADPVFE